MEIGGIIGVVIASLIVACAVIVGVFFLLGYVTFATFVRRRNNDNDLSKAPIFAALGPDFAKYREFVKEKAEEFEKVPFEWVSVKSKDGLKLSGRYYKQEGAPATVICMPGFGPSAYIDCGQFGNYWLGKGFNLLLVTNRARGESEGQYLGFGTLEAEDLKVWVAAVVAKNPEAKIFIHGCSAGATAAMLASAKDLPNNVKGIIEDSGYTRTWDVFVYQIKQVYKLAPFPILHIAELFTKKKAKYNFRASAVKAVSMSGVPILFIHGASDKLAPTYMCNALHAACTAPKDILVVEGAGHMQSYMRATEAYEAKLDEFVEKNLH